MTADAAISEPEWGDLPRNPTADSGPVLSVEGFEGPLDWLVEMVRARKLDLSRLSILALIESFAAAMTAALAQRRLGGRAADLQRWWAWLVMAADLAQLRSRLLMPDDGHGAALARAEAERLRRILADRAEVGWAADWLERRPQLGHQVFARGRPGSGLLERNGQASSAGSASAITELLRACLVALRLPAGATEPVPHRPPFWRPGDALARIARLLGKATGGRELDAFLPKLRAGGPDHAVLCRGAVAATFVAGLELARSGTATLAQDQPWATIRIGAAGPGPGARTPSPGGLAGS